MGRSAPVAKAQLRVLDRLTALPGIERWYLAGGTGLAWHLGHRRSADLDLFSLDPDAVPGELARQLEGARVLGLTDVAAHLTVHGVAVDLVRYPYAPLHPPTPGPGGVAVASVPDLAAMKVAAVAQRGLRRDFWDVYAIGHAGVSLQDAVAAYRRRFGRSASDPYHVLRAMVYFDDAERDPVFPRGLTRGHWSEVKAWFVEHVPRLVVQPNAP